MTPVGMAALHARCFETPPPWSEDTFATLCADPAILSEHRDGAFAVWRVAVDEAELLTLAVAPTRRRRGLARTLVNSGAARLRAAGVHRLVLEVAASNHAARALYAREGFRQAGRRPGYYRRPDGSREDALVLIRQNVGAGPPAGESPEND